MHTQVAVVGGGPVGLGLAIELGLRGVDVVVIEKESALHHIPKGQNLTQRTMEHLRVWGVEQAVREARVMPHDYPAAGINAYGNLMSRYAHPWFRRSAVDRYYFAASERLPQYRTEKILRDRVSGLPSVTVRFGTEARSVHGHGEQLVVGTDEGDVAADFVVGCDGSRSMVRQEAGIGNDRSDHERRMALIVFRSRELHDLLEGRFGEAAFFNVLDPELDGYWRFLGRVDVGETWFFHAPVSSDATPGDLDARALLFESVGVVFHLDVEHVGLWDLRISIADTYRQGNIFIAGDAAHSHPPYGGYGINTGLEDARNLGWKLAAVIEGWGGSNLLASYTEERRPVFVSTARDFIEAYIERDRAFINHHDPALDEKDFAAAWERRGSTANRGVDEFEPHYEGSSIVVGSVGASPGAIGEHSFTPRPGHHLPPAGLGASEGIFDVLGPWFTLVASTDRRNIIDTFESAARRLGIPLIVVTEGSAAAVARYERSPILVRPDHFISWIDDGTETDTETVLRQSVGRGSAAANANEP